MEYSLVQPAISLNVSQYKKGSMANGYCVYEIHAKTIQGVDSINGNTSTD